jgi:hypothetical protein
MYNGHCVRSGETVLKRPWPLAKASSYILVLESLINWCYLSFF